jgi:hypothetical protein
MKFNKIIGDELVSFCDNCDNYEHRCFCTGTITCGCGIENKPEELDCRNCSKYFHQEHGCSYGQPDGSDDYIKDCECPHN